MKIVKFAERSSLLLAVLLGLATLLNYDAVLVFSDSIYQNPVLLGDTLADYHDAGGNNINVNPLFVDAIGTDNTVGTADDNLRLQSTSPCIDAADRSPLQAQSVTTDFDGNPRFLNATTIPDTGAGTHPHPDMGAYEVQSDCPLPGDLNCDGIANEFDFALMAANWLATL